MSIDSILLKASPPGLAGSTRPCSTERREWFRRFPKPLDLDELAHAVEDVSGVESGGPA